MANLTSFANLSEWTGGRILRDGTQRTVSKVLYLSFTI